MHFQGIPKVLEFRIQRGLSQENRPGKEGPKNSVSKPYRDVKTMQESEESTYFYVFMLTMFYITTTITTGFFLSLAWHVDDYNRSTCQASDKITTGG